MAGNREAGNRTPAIYYLASLIAGLLAMGTKESAASLPVFVYLYEWYFIQNLSRDWMRRNAAYLITALVALGFAGLMYLGFDPMERILAGYGRRDFTLGQRLLTEPRVVVFYLGLIFIPHPARLNLDHHFTISQSLIDPASTVLCLLVLAGLSAAAFFTARHHRLLSFGIVWFLGNLVIESSVIGLELAFEHRNYLPSMFLILAGIAGGFKVSKRTKAVVTVFTIVAVIFTLWTIQRNRVWQNRATLWQDAAMKSPNKARPHHNLALALAEKGQSVKAIEHYRRAIEIDPDKATFHTDLAVELAALGDLRGAMRHYDKALAIVPEFFLAHLSMGKTLIQSGDRDAAMAHFEKASEIKPNSAELHKTLGLLALSDRQLNKAARHFAKAIKANPDDDDAYNSLGAAFMRGNRFDKAAKLFFMAGKLNPANAQAKANLRTAIRAMIDRNRRQFELAEDN
ncbi:MAG: tetratricopeptide repeat protein [Desulfobacterales bacterium]